jgi:hypothetical protein
LLHPNYTGKNLRKTSEKPLENLGRFPKEVFQRGFAGSLEHLGFSQKPTTKPRAGEPGANGDANSNIIGAVSHAPSTKKVIRVSFSVLFFVSIVLIKNVLIYKIYIVYII